MPQTNANIQYSKFLTMIPSKDGYSDRDNWFLSSKEWNSGRSIVEYEAHLLVKYAGEGKIYDMEINNLLYLLFLKPCTHCFSRN